MRRPGDILLSAAGWVTAGISLAVARSEPDFALAGRDVSRLLLELAPGPCLAVAGAVLAYESLR